MRLLFALTASLLVAAPLSAAQQTGGRTAARKPAVTVPAVRKPDLADMLVGRWAGDVISDSKGSSRSNVTLIIERIGPNIVTIRSDYARLPVITVPIERVMQIVMQRSGNSVFLYDPTRTPPKLDVSFNHEVSWSGSRE